MSTPAAEQTHMISPNHTILVVDDSRMNLRVLTQSLETYGYKTLRARSGEEAIQQARQQHPDIILLDVMMPGIDGFETCRRLKSDPRTQDIPVIFMTALTDTDNKVKGFQEGAVDYITKPIQQDEVLARVATHLSIRDLTRNLQNTNQDLVQALDELKTTQKHLVESEKMAALGVLVAGVAHEINTPLGVGITASSALEDETKKFLDAYNAGNLTRSALQTYLRLAEQSSRIILKNLLRAADLVRNFKQVAGNQMNLELRTFPVKQYIEDTILSVLPEDKREQYSITILGDDHLSISGHPGAFSQVISNLLVNSITHAYQKDQPGNLCFVLRQEKERLLIVYSDDGQGIPAENLNKIFEPFFTTARGLGKTGLGMYMVYNLVTQTLKGTIHCESEPGMGTKFILNLPIYREQ